MRNHLGPGPTGRLDHRGHLVIDVRVEQNRRPHPKGREPVELAGAQNLALEVDALALEERAEPEQELLQGLGLDVAEEVGVSKSAKLGVANGWLSRRWDGDRG